MAEPRRERPFPPPPDRSASQAQPGTPARPLTALERLAARTAAAPAGAARPAAAAGGTLAGTRTPAFGAPKPATPFRAAAPATPASPRPVTPFRATGTTGAIGATAPRLTPSGRPIPELIALTPAATTVDEAGYARLAAAAQSMLGMDLTQYKPAQVWRRVNSFASARGYAGPDVLLDACKADPVLRDAFRDMLTINVSEFFRNAEIWERLAREYLPGILRPGAQARIWSAGCSVGFEPYTIAMLAKEGFPQAGYKTVATDLDSVALAQAQSARYRDEQMLGVSPARRQRFFRQAPDGRWEVLPELKTPITFKRHDLLADRYETAFDLVVCRNVVIYFTEDAKRLIFERFAQSLRPGGILLIGATEAINAPRAIGLTARGGGFYERTAG